jgi:hypothetical protein
MTLEVRFALGRPQSDAVDFIVYNDAMSLVVS